MTRNRNGTPMKSAVAKDLSKTAARLSTAAVLIAAASLIGAAPAAANPGRGTTVDMNAQCAAQYPAADGYNPGQAYQVAPRDSYSWRCQRVSKLSDGGIIVELPVDPAAYCAPLSANPAPAGSPNWPNWICT